MRDYKVFGYCVLHYGKDYLPYSIQSVYDLVDRFYIFYTPHPSHGHKTDVPPIETKHELLDAVTNNFGFSVHSKLRWHETDIWHEGQQRDHAVKTLTDDGADLILVLDYDEIWHDYTLDRALSHVWGMNATRHWLVNMVHMWRSFSWACRDSGWPVRIIDTRHRAGTSYVDREFGDIYHFGYAVTDKVMRYKWECHGHKDELRPDWYRDKWSVWPPPDDCHPTNGKNEDGIGWWNPEPFDKRTLPYAMRSHPFYNLERID